MDVVRVGTIDYQTAWDKQKALHEGVVSGALPDTVLLLEHPSVYTAGKLTEDWERPRDGTPVIDIDRGGRITWHGPGQIVGYPIIKLPVGRGGLADVVAHVRRIEAMIIAVCRDLGVETKRIKGKTGVWVDEGEEPHPHIAAGLPQANRKIASIGVRVARGVSMHGFAINCNPDMVYFDNIVPCGIKDATATSLSGELGRIVTVEEVLPIVERHLPTLLGDVS